MKKLLVVILTLVLCSKTIIAQENKVFTVNGVSFEKVYVEGGTFTMGCTERYIYNRVGEYSEYCECLDDEYPHSVTLGNYYIGKYEVTQELWLAVMGYEPSPDPTLTQYNNNYKPWLKGGWSDEIGKGDNYPAYDIDWDEAQQFVNKLSEMTGRKFSLPTEAEWEYAARGGKKSRGYIYSGSDRLEDVTWYGSRDYTHPVGKKRPNELGIYDMCGNVMEWCRDWYEEYGNVSQTNPMGPTYGSYRTCRGYDYWGVECYYAVWRRNYDNPTGYNLSKGIRIVLH